MYACLNRSIDAPLIMCETLDMKGNKSFPISCIHEVLFKEMQKRGYSHREHIQLQSEKVDRMLMVIESKH